MKHTQLTPALYDFLLSSRSGAKDTLLDQLSAETRELGEISGMQIAPEQGSFLTLLVAALGVRRAVEIGTFTGTSSIYIARGLPEGGKLTCLDQSGEWTQIARRFWEQAGVAHKIELRLGNARESVHALDEGPYDFAFIDADKTGYETYYEALLPKMRPGALFVFDNMLRGGRVVDPQSEDDEALRVLNQKLAKDTRVQSVLLPVADGLNLARVL